MAGRLTGLEYRWFGKGQLLATRHRQGEAADLDLAASAVVAEVTEDARVSLSGPESLRRVAARFALNADELDAGWMNATSPEPTAVVVIAGAEGRLAARRVAALRRLATRLNTAAAEMEART